jgi:hypothetical protein
MTSENPPSHSRSSVSRRQVVPPIPRRSLRLDPGAVRMSMDVTSVGAHLEYDCAEGLIEEPLRPDGEGRFTAIGTHTPGHGSDPEWRKPAIVSCAIRWSRKQRADEPYCHLDRGGHSVGLLRAPTWAFWCTGAVPVVRADFHAKRSLECRDTSRQLPYHYGPPSF